MSESLFSINNVSVTFKTQNRVIKAVDHVSFNIETGKTVGLVGESGSGKTTIGRAITGIGPISSGEILYQGKSLANFKRKDKQFFKRHVQMIFQDPFESLNLRLKVGDIIAEGIDNFHLAGNKQARIKMIQDLLEQVGLPRESLQQFPHEFSGGQRQRIGIARALAVAPEFLVLDEPISALDVSIQAQIVNLLRSIQKAKKLTYLFIAHDLSMVRYISDVVLVMYHGRIVEYGPTELVYKHPLHPYTKALLSAVPHADPIYEHNKHIEQFKPSSISQPIKLVEELPQHFVALPVK